MDPVYRNTSKFVEESYTGPKPSKFLYGESEPPVSVSSVSSTSQIKKKLSLITL
jgi:hypothetical protein